MKQENSSFSVSIDFNAIRLPPVRDILVLGKKFPQGKTGVMECFRFIAPDEFEMFDVPDQGVEAEAVLINRRLLKRMPATTILGILNEHVFPYVARGEALNVDFGVKIHISGVEAPRDP